MRKRRRRKRKMLELKEQEGGREEVGTGEESVGFAYAGRQRSNPSKKINKLWRRDKKGRNKRKKKPCRKRAHMSN